MKQSDIKKDAQMQIRAAIDTLKYARISTDQIIRVLQSEAQLVLIGQTDTAPSDEFLYELSHSGALVITCEFCNRTYFAYKGDYDEGELEDLQSKAKKNPEKYIETSDFTSWGTVNGKQFVIDCPCNGVKGIENWLWSHRYIVESFFRRKAQRIKEDAELQISTAASVSASMKTVEDFDLEKKEDNCP